MDNDTGALLFVGGILLGIFLILALVFGFGNEVIKRDTLDYVCEKFYGPQAEYYDDGIGTDTTITCKIKSVEMKERKVELYRKNEC